MSYFPAYGVFQLSSDLNPTLSADLQGGGYNLDDIGVIFLKEQADADADVAGYGQLWVNTATPNELWFTDDAGTDVQLGAGAGGFTADVDTQIAPTTAIVLDHASNNEIVLNLDYTIDKVAGTVNGIILNATETSVPSTHLPFDIQIGGVSQANFNNTGQLTLDPAGTFANTTGLKFGDGDSGIYEAADDTLYFRVGGIDRFYIQNSSVALGGVTFFGGLLPTLLQYSVMSQIFLPFSVGSNLLPFG